MNIAIGVIAVLCLSNIVFSILLIREIQINRILIAREKQAEKPLAQVAKTEEKQIPAKPEEKKPVQPAALPGLPLSLIHASSGEYVLFCEKETNVLHLFRFTDNAFELVKTYKCITGANHKDKQTNGDLATPEGVFFTLRFIDGGKLPKQYGFGAYVLNYPNFLAKKEGKKGNGIWLHGHSTDKNIGTDILNTKGCVVVENDVLKELSRFIRANGTPIVIVNRMEASLKEKQQSLSQDIQAFMTTWKKSWESMNMKKYLSLYASEFTTSDGMDYNAFRKHKENVNKGKSFIRVDIHDMAVLMPQGYEGKIAVVRFVQRYASNNFKSESKKLFYLTRKDTSWQIIAESVF